MKAKNIIIKCFRAVGFGLMALVLLLAGVLMLAYSPWAQDNLRETLVSRISTPENRLQFDSFRLRFPLRIEASGLVMSDASDTLVSARSVNVDVALLPLLAGKVNVDKAILTGVRYRMGTPDSAMYMKIAADSLGLSPASVKLSDMAINLERGTIRGGNLSMVMKADTLPSAPASQPTRMSIALGKIQLDDFTFNMRMLPSIDTLTTSIVSSELVSGKIDMLAQTIDLRSFAGSGLSARYIAPDSATIAAGGPYEPTQPVDTSTTKPWTITIDSIDFNHSDALYTTADVTPLPGLDFSYIAVDSLSLKLRNFYNQATDLRLPLSLSGRERCGVMLNLNGELDIDSTSLVLKTVHLSTPEGTSAVFDGLLGMGDMATDTTVPLQLNLDGQFSPADLSLMFPAFSPYFAAVPRGEDIQLVVEADGTTGRLDIPTLGIDLNRCVSIDASGYVENIMQPEALGGDIKIKGRIIDVRSFKNAMLSPEMAKTVQIPPMTVDGHLAMHRGIANGKIAAFTKGGNIKANAYWNSKGSDYKASLATNGFPVQAFMPLLGVENLTATMNVNGQGYSPFEKSTTIKADLDIASVTYQKTRYTEITATANLADGKADLNVESSNTDADFSINASGNLDGKVYNWTATLDGRYIDLLALNLATAPSSVEATLKAEAVIGPGKNDITAHINIDDVIYRTVGSTIALNGINSHINASDSLTAIKITNRDFLADFSSPLAPDTLLTGFSTVGEIVSKQIELYSINADTIREKMPAFDLIIRGGNNNLVNDILASSKMSVRSFDLRASKDTVITMDGYVRRFDTGSMVLDSIFLGARQHNNHLHFDAGVQNRPGNLDEWHKVTLTGAAGGNELSLRLQQSNIKDKTGFDIGLAAEASAADSSLTVHVRPYDPIIGYQSWAVNSDNFITYTLPTKHIDANLRMDGENSSLAIYTEAPEGHDAHGHSQEDLVIKLGNIKLQDWITVNPFAPPVKGSVNADLRLNRHNDILTGNGTASISDLIYGKERVADFKADFDVAATAGGTLYAKADLMVNGAKTITVRGALNDSTAMSPLALDFSVIHFPLNTANPFLPPTVGKLSGMLNGNLKISGTQQAPIFNGTLDFDSTAVRLAMTGTEYKFSSTPIDVVDNLVTFNNFAISACNDNPLTINGNVDIGDMTNMKMNLSMKADNMMIVNSRKPSRGADIYGKGYISLDANAHGSMKLLQVNADVSVNPGTDITYIIPDATNAIANKSVTDMVRFVNFTDSIEMAYADSIAPSGMAMLLDAVLKIEQGSTFNVFLSTDGANRVQLQSNGTLSYSMSPLDSGRLTGRLNITRGFVRYTPPFMSEKLFNFNDNSYVSFTGQMMNPVLNVSAVDIIKANVTADGQNSRLINFDVLLSVTGTLDKMNVQFDLTTNDDVTVANELESMSPEQRANQAMNMLLYNVYTGPGTKGNASLSGNPLFSFLESQINTWAANNIKGVDLSFGIDQYDRTVNGSTSSAMSYSYQVSKTLFNDRFKIVIGGNYSTDANADENFSQNLINDISFEYFLNDKHTMYVRLFRHTGYESILEGEITQTGVGFVYTRKLRRLGDMFIPEKIVNRRREQQAAAAIKPEDK